MGQNSSADWAVPNLQFPPVFPAHISSRTLHHPTNPLYSIIILSHPFSTPAVTAHLMFSNRAISNSNHVLHHVFGMTYHLNSAPFLRLHCRHCQSQDIIFIRLLYPTPPGPFTQN